MWLSAGDKNSGYFHAVAKGRRARNRMSVIEDDGRNTFYEEEHIAGQISSYFERIFTTNSSNNSPATISRTRDIVYNAINPNLSNDANGRLCSVPDTAEIKQTLFLIHPDKAPSPDGFSASFFHSN